MSETYELEVKNAIRIFWRTRAKALAETKKRGKTDRGNRGGATTGKNLDGFSKLIEKEARRAANDEINVHLTKKLVTLPGYFRPTKQWDIVVMKNDTLLAVIELKSLGGPSFGNNANNRCEEAIGSAIDFRMAQREGAFGRGASPFLAYFILVQDEAGSSRPPAKAPVSIHFACDDRFKKASYQDRMVILCERMMQEGLYDCAAVMSSPPGAGSSGTFQDLSQPASFRRLLALLRARVSAETEVL